MALLMIVNTRQITPRTIPAIDIPLLLFLIPNMPRTSATIPTGNPIIGIIHASKPTIPKTSAVTPNPIFLKNIGAYHYDMPPGKLFI